MKIALERLSGDANALTSYVKAVIAAMEKLR